MFEDVSGAPADGPAADPANGGKPVQLAQAPAEPIGSVEELTGTVTLTRADGSTSTAAPGDPVFLNDTVATASGSSVEITFVDGTRFSLGQDGQMTLDQLVYDPGGGDNELDLSVVQGAFTFVTGAIAGAPGEGMEVNLPVGTIGIRGTAVGGGPDGTTPDPTDYTVVLLPEEGGRFGRIVLTDVNGRSVILDQPLEAMDISSLGLAPGEPVVLTREQVLDLLGLAVENLEDILEEVQNFESLEDQQTPEAGPQQRGDILPGSPNTGGVNTPRGETRSLDELTTLFSLSDQQGLGGDDQGGPLGGFTPGGGLGNEDNNPPAGPSDPDRPTGSDPVTTDSPPPGSGLFVLTGGEGDDLLDASDIGAANIIGLGGNDTLVGSSQDDILQGGDGDDTLDAGAGNDQVFGGGGNDTIIGGSGQGNDHYDGGAGIDTVKYSSATQSITVNLETGVASGDPAIGSDTLVDVENVIGGGGSDFITGDGAANRLEGGAGDDELTGGGGNDTIVGGDGDDVAVFGGNRDDYQITGGEGGFYVTDLRDGANDGTDFVAYDVEALRFADQEVAVAPKAFDDFHVVSESQQEVTNGAAMRTTVTASAGSVLTLKVNFLDSEPDGAEETFKDFAVIVIDGQVFKLADVDASETPLGNASVQFDEQTGYFTFTFEFATSGEHEIGIAVLNEGDELYDAGLLIDDLSITGGSGEGFENGLGGWETIGSVSVESEVAGIPAPEGGQQALLVSKGVSSAAVEQFLGLAPGQLSTLGNQPVISGNVLGNDATGAADVAVASVVYSGDPDDVQDVNGTTANGITTFMASDGSWKLEFNLATGDYVFTVLEILSHPGSDALSFPFTYSIEGVTGIVSNATLTILVNDGVPSAVDDVATATEGGEATGGNLLFNDGFSPDGAWITSITIGGQTHDMLGGEPIAVETPLGGWLVVQANGEWSYEPPAVVEGNSPVAESFTYTVTDGDGDPSSATVGITVSPATNQAPSIPVDEDGTLNSISRYAPLGATVGIVASSIDPEGTEVTYSLEDPSEVFEIDSETGVVTVANRDALQSTASQSLAITIIASDAGGLTSSQTFVIDVTNDGTPGDDVITGTEQDDEISALAGNDAILGLAGDDILKGDEGTDMLVGGAGNDELDGGDGMDYAVYTDAASGVTVDLREGIASDGQGGIDSLTSIEHVHGGGYSDLIHGDQGANFLFGGAGDDELYGHGGDDFLNGGAGDDQIDGGEGHDTVSYAENVQGISVDLAEQTADQGYDIGDDLLFNIESVIGTEYSDWIAGDGNNNTITGNGGADVLEGREGDDVLVFENQDQLESIEQVDGGEGRDTLRIIGDGESIDLSPLHSMASIERIDTSGNGANEIALSAADVIYLSGQSEFDENMGGQVDVLTVLGDAADTVTFHDPDNWQKQAGGPVTVDGTLFNVYVTEGAKLYIEAEIGGQPIA